MGFQRRNTADDQPIVSTGRKCFILAAAILCNSLVEGLCQSFPELYPIFLEEFKHSGGARIVLIGSLLPGIYLVTSPVYCLLLGKFDFLVVMAAGSILSSLGFIGSSMAHHGDQLILCYALLTGVGFGAIHLSSIVVVSRSFHSNRGAAMALVLSASAFSGFVVSPCTRTLVSSYGWRGANQIYGAVLLNGIACGMIFNRVNPNRSALGILRSKLRRLVSRIRSKEEESRGSYIMRQMIRERERIKETSTGSLDGCVITTDNTLVSGSQALCAQQYFEESFTWKSDDLDCLYLETGGHFSRSINYRVTSGDVVLPTRATGKVSEVRELLSVLRHASFVVFIVTFIVSFIASFLVIMNLPKHAFFVGLNVNQSRFLLTLLWAVSAGFRIPIGWTSDRGKAFKFVLYSSTLVVCGILALVMPCISSYELLLPTTVFLGLFMACLVTLNPIFLMDIFDTRQFPRSYSISSLFQGLSTMTAPLLPRWIPLSHSNSFIVAGSLIAVAGLVSLPLKWLGSENGVRDKETLS